MINVNDLRNGTVFKEERELWQVVNYEHIKMGRGSGNIKIKARNLKTGSTIEKSFITGARIEEADVEKKKTQFLYCDRKGAIETSTRSGEDSYRNGENYFFMDPLTFEQFSLAQNIVGEQSKYLKDGLEVQLIVSDEVALGMEIPNSLVYEITETGPGEKGNTVSSVFKDAVLDNGLAVKVPMFAKIGDKIKVDTRTGEYVERVK